MFTSTKRDRRAVLISFYDGFGQPIHESWLAFTRPDSEYSVEFADDERLDKYPYGHVKRWIAYVTELKKHKDLVRRDNGWSLLSKCYRPRCSSIRNMLLAYLRPIKVGPAVITIYDSCGQKIRIGFGDPETELAYDIRKMLEYLLNNEREGDMQKICKEFYASMQLPL